MKNFNQKLTSENGKLWEALNALTKVDKKNITNNKKIGCWIGW